VDRWAKLIESSGLSSVALSLLEEGAAFGFLGRQALLAVEPLMRSVPGTGIEPTADRLGDPELWRQLRDRLIRGHSSDE
jgi:hypothetical protein